ncbi:MAG: hypothetical protein EA397_03450 [Deltaproteobacteria bacterium]|nr:MAG: hypothetical protein EA397_03450 [Deltaproteobacteria bacterium]
MFGSSGPWPFAGHFRGSVQWAELTLHWSGQLAASDGPERAFAAAQAVHRALAADPPSAALFDRPRLLSHAFAAVDAVPNERLGSRAGEDLSLLLAVSGSQGASVAAVGVHNLYVADAREELHRWVRAPHPLLGVPVRAAADRGALSVERLPPVLLAAAQGEPGRGRTLSEGLLACGVR